MLQVTGSSGCRVIESKEVCGPMIPRQETDFQADMRAVCPQGSGARSSQHAFARIPSYLNCQSASRSSAPISGAVF
jgi:hypothetical protein